MSRVARRAKAIARRGAIGAVEVAARRAPWSVPLAASVVGRVAPPARAHSVVRGLLWRRVQRGEAGAAAAHARRIAGHDRSYADLAHELALRAGDLDGAASVEALVTTEAEREYLVVERLLAARDGAAAAQIVGARANHDARAVSQQLRVLVAVGRFDRVLEVLAEHGERIDALTARVLRIEALRWTGRVAEAAVLTEQLVADHLLDPRVFRLVSDADGAGSTATVQRLRDAAPFDDLDAATASRLLPLLWVAGEHDAVATIGAAVAARYGRGAMTPAARLTLARNDYVRRDFDQALERIDRLRGTSVRLEAEKLRARILLEQGHHAAAIVSRDANPDPPEWLDEVRYHALLQQRRPREAYVEYLPRTDLLALRAVFGDRADVGPDFDHVGRRLVVSQMGPGDEVLLTSTYAALADRSDELIATCEPRLQSLLERSFPTIRFVPVERWTHPRPGVVGPDRPTRSDDALFAVLTAEARDLGLTCDRVLLGRSLHWLWLRPGTPTPAYLVPDPEAVVEQRSRSTPSGRRIGVVWRSEFRSPMRSIHYVEVADLAGVLAADDVVVCLQYDAEPDELADLRELFPGRVVTVDDVDLRNDLESTAAVVASLDAVVGIGTTTVELSAAVGTPTVLLTPNHHGTWRSVDADGHDHWHASMRVAVVAEPWDRPALARRARTLLDALIGDDTPTPEHDTA